MTHFNIPNLSDALDYTILNCIGSIYPSGGFYQWIHQYPPGKVYLTTSGKNLFSMYNNTRLIYDQCEYWMKPYYNSNNSNNNEWYLTYQLIWEYRIEPHYTTLFGAK